MKLIGYIRVSEVGRRAGDSFQSPTQQKTAITRYAKEHGHEMVGWKTDLDQSGGKASRPAFDEALAIVESGQADGIIVERLNRFARNVAGASRLIERIEGPVGNRTGRAVISVKENIDPTTTEGRFMRNIYLSVGEMELDSVRERGAAAAEHARRRGVVGARPPFGYMLKDGRWVINPKQAKLVHELFGRRAKGESWVSLCEWLDVAAPGGARGEGKRWGIGTLSELIKRRSYLGEIPNTQQTDPEAPRYYPGHEAILTEREWLAAQGPKGTHVRAEDGGALLQGIIKCHCGATMTRMGNGSVQTSRGTTRYYNYKCSDRTCGNKAMVSCKSADAFVEGAVLAAFGQDTVEVHADVDAMTDYEAAQAELAAFLLNVPATTPGYADAVAARQAEIDAAAARVQEQASDSTVNYREAWQSAVDVITKRRIIKALFPRIEVSPSVMGEVGTGGRKAYRRRQHVAERLIFHLPDGSTIGPRPAPVG